MTHLNARGFIECVVFGRRKLRAAARALPAPHLQPRQVLQVLLVHLQGRGLQGFRVEVAYRYQSRAMPKTRLRHS